MQNASNRYGIILCGGESTRMGRAKADLPFGSETLLKRIVRVLEEVTNHIVVVAAADQQPPDLGPDVSVAQDAIAGGGPIIGLSAGLHAIQQLANPDATAFVTSCDAPFLRSEFVSELFRQVPDHDVAVPKDNQFYYPLAAVYRTSVVQKIDRLIEEGVRRPRALFPECRTIEIPTASLKMVDPDLSSLINVNSPSDYLTALQREDLPIPPWLNA